MKRLHIHVKVTDLTQSIDFYNALFNTSATVVKSDYAKWMLDDPKVNFAISSGHAQTGVEHLGIQAEDEGELQGIYANMKNAKGKILEEGETVCCYAKSQKSWITDPQGVNWEAFYTHGEATVYGEGEHARPAPEVMQQWKGNDAVDAQPVVKAPCCSPTCCP
mgnify:CR=1 FL=1